MAKFMKTRSSNVIWIVYSKRHALWMKTVNYIWKSLPHILKNWTKRFKWLQFKWVKNVYDQRVTINVNVLFGITNGNWKWCYFICFPVPFFLYEPKKLITVICFVDKSFSWKSQDPKVLVYSIVKLLVFSLIAYWELFIEWLNIFVFQHYFLI